MGSFYPNSEQVLFLEFQDAQKRMNAAFSGANQVTLATRLRLAIDMVACVLRDVDSTAAQTEIVSTLIDELIDLLPTIDMRAPGQAPFGPSSGRVSGNFSSFK